MKKTTFIINWYDLDEGYCGIKMLFSEGFILLSTLISIQQNNTFVKNQYLAFNIIVHHYFWGFCFYFPDGRQCHWSLSLKSISSSFIYLKYIGPLLFSKINSLFKSQIVCVYVVYSKNVWTMFVVDSVFDIDLTKLLTFTVWRQQKSEYKNVFWQWPKIWDSLFFNSWSLKHTFFWLFGLNKSCLCMWLTNFT